MLASIYLLASDTQTISQGAILLLVYSAGLGIPFLLTGAAFSTATGLLHRLNRHLRLISVITGFFLIAVGVLLFMDRLTAIANVAMARLGMGLAGLEVGGSSSVVTLPVAFAAGVLSFLSPCVLPLIPAYLGYLSGTALAPAGRRDPNVSVEVRLPDEGAAGQIARLVDGHRPAHHPALAGALQRGRRDLRAGALPRAGLDAHRRRGASAG